MSLDNISVNFTKKADSDNLRTRSGDLTDTNVVAKFHKKSLRRLDLLSAETILNEKVTGATNEVISNSDGFMFDKSTVPKVSTDSSLKVLSQKLGTEICHNTE